MRVHRSEFGTEIMTGRKIIRPLAGAAAVLSLAWGLDPQAEIQRNDFFVDSDPGVHLFVREVVTASGRAGAIGQPILLLHGARVPGLASFDLPVPGGSFAQDLGTRGLDVYVMDVRGYGRSTRPPQMEEPPDAHAPSVRSNEAARDISAVVDAICTRRDAKRVAIFRWATGGQWAGYYASAHADKVGALILLNSLSGQLDAATYRTRHGFRRSRASRSFQSGKLWLVSLQRCGLTASSLGSQHSRGRQERVARPGRGEGLRRRGTGE